MTEETPPEDEEDQEPAYEVGFGKPPKHSQFKAGNKMAKGRPRGSRNLKAIVNEVLMDKVPAQINGKTRKISRLELSVRQLAQKAVAGDLKAIEKLLSLSERHAPLEEEGPIPEEETAYDLETMQHLLAMRGATSGD